MADMPTLFNDSALAKFEQTCRQLLEPAGHMHALVMQSLHLCTEIQASRQREKFLTDQNGSLQRTIQGYEEQVQAQAKELERLRDKLRQTEDTCRQVQETANNLDAERTRLKGARKE